MNMRKTEKAPVKKAEAPKKEAPKPAVAKPDMSKYNVEIKKRAYEIFQERLKTKKPGDSQSDWIQAEKEIKEKYKL
ncbi:MAG: DUF2934 domain-containing protein [Candidatus Helarchaeota archaeon]|nr:DUF2934 domain-containing protein [Candidatus Helarchaeota archaeon]